MVPASRRSLSLVVALLGCSDGQGNDGGSTSSSTTNMSSVGDEDGDLTETGTDDDTTECDDGGGGPILVSPFLPYVVTVCGPDVDDRELPTPVFEGRCGRTVVDVVGVFWTKIDLYPIDPLDLINGTVRLPVGDRLVRWTAIDDEGYESAFDQRVSHHFQNWSDVCCDGRLVIAGSVDDDMLSGDEEEASCVYGYGGNDLMSSGPEADRLEGGGGHDIMDTGSSNSQLLGGSGNDSLTVWDGIGQVLYGGAGDDTLTVAPILPGGIASGAGRWFWGGPGDDYLLGGVEDEVFFPGSGIDFVSAGDGDDLVIFHDICEIEDFTVLIGGEGDDELVLPVSVEELPANVEIYEFETITVDATRAYVADCHNPP